MEGDRRLKRPGFKRVSRNGQRAGLSNFYLSIIILQLLGVIYVYDFPLGETVEWEGAEGHVLERHASDKKSSRQNWASMRSPGGSMPHRERRAFRYRIAADQ